LPGIQERRGLVHAASLHDSHEHEEIVQFHLAADPIAHPHRLALLSRN
jgi:hypothetical protein